MKLTKSMMMAALAGAAMNGFADVWWVDAANYGKSGLDGKTVETAYGTIQDAVNAAAANDTIKVQPGVYDKGGYNDSNKLGRSRVHIYGKKLTIVATSDNLDDTHIVGKWDSNPDETIGHGIGSTDQYRCIAVRQAVGTIIRGFTIRDGATKYYATTSDATRANGGALIALNASDGYSSDAAYLVDCKITGCSGIRGGAMRGGTAVRCRITDNYSYLSGAVGRKCSFVNCIMSHNENGSRSDLLYEIGAVVNCTVVNNLGRVEGGPVYNSVVMHNTYDGEGNVSDVEAHNFVTKYDGGNPRYRENSEFDTCHTNMWDHQFIAPLFDDYRVKKGSVTETVGDANWLASGTAIALPDEIDPYLDIDGNVIPSEGAICAGASQTVVTPLSGAVEVSDRKTILSGPDGIPCYGKELYAYASDCYPTQFLFQAVNKGNPHIFSFFTDDDKWLFPTMDDRIALIPFADTNNVRTVLVYNPSQRLSVDPVDGVDDADARAELSSDAPYKTIQGAIDASTATDRVLVEAAEGDYKEGGSGVNRVSSGQQIRIVGAGAGKSVIWGEEPTEEGEPGKRCVYLSDTSALQGFTLRDGHMVTTSKYGTEVDSSFQRGGALCAKGSTGNTDVHLLDCVITNCYAYRGGAVYGGSLERCHVVDCYSGNGVCRYTVMYSCVVDHLTPVSGATGISNSYGQLFNCTLIGRSTSEYVINENSSDIVTNCIIMTTKSLCKKLNAGYTIVWDVPSCTIAGLTVTNPYLANRTTDNYRPTDMSPALGFGEVWNHYNVNGFDYEGNPLRFEGGKVTAGAYQWPVKSVEVTPPAYGTLVPSGYAGVDADGTLSLTYTESSARHLLGYEVNGVMTSAPGSGTLKIALSDEEVASGVTIGCVFSTNWYVNANTDPAKGVVGDNANDGFTPDTPWATIGYAMDNANVQKYDTIHAAAGVYTNETVKNNRMVTMRAYCTLVGDEGPEKTFIIGRAGNPAGATEEERMCTSNSVCCVYIPYNYSHLKGFTLTGGHTYNVNSENLSNCGGAVFMAGNAANGISSVSDCIISNNYSGRSACYKGKYFNCRIIDNYALYNTSATRNSTLVNCIVDGNRGKTTMMAVKFVNSVIGPNNKTQDGSAEVDIAYEWSGLTNCVVLGKCGTTGKNNSIDHSFILADKVGSMLVVTDCDTTCTTLAEMGLGEDFRPLAADSPVVDFGTRNIPEDLVTAVDLAGSQRVYNAKIDVGPYEFDWRGTYSSVLGGGVNVTAASPEVERSGSAVVVPSGSGLDLTWANSSGKPRKAMFTATVAEDTELAVKRDGEDLATFEEGTTKYLYKSGVGEEALAFSVSGLGSAALSDFMRVRGTALFVK